MKKFILTSLLTISLAIPAFAQTPVGGSERLAWNHDGVNVSRFEVSIDGGAPTTIGATLQAGGTEYRAPMPSLTPGDHTIAITACNVAGCSAPALINVRVVVIPAPVQNLRITPPGSN